MGGRRAEEKKLSVSKVTFPAGVFETLLFAPFLPLLSFCLAESFPRPKARGAATLLLTLRPVPD